MIENKKSVLAVALKKSQTKQLFACIVLLLNFGSLQAESLKPSISLIIDDLGNHSEHGLNALSLDGAITFAILPNTPFSTILAELAHEKGKQVMVHLPMESEHHDKLGPNALRANMSEQELKQQINSALMAVPYAVGLNNHMGSLLTKHAQPMKWLMQVLAENKLFFIDSRTTTETVALKTARNMGVKAARRNVFLDNEKQEDYIRGQFRQLLLSAKINGHAVGIAHPHPETIRVLKMLLPEVEKQGIKLVFASSIIDHQQQKMSNTQENSLWVESLSPSRRDVKN